MAMQESGDAPPIGGHWYTSKTLWTAAATILTAAGGLTFLPAHHRELVLFLVVVLNTVGTLFARKGGVDAAKDVAEKTP